MTSRLFRENQGTLLGIKRYNAPNIFVYQGVFRYRTVAPPALSNRFLFSSKSSNSVFADGETRPQYILTLGDLHGITKGTEFTIYRKHDTIHDSEALGKMVVCAVGSDEARLSFCEDQHFDLPTNFCAVQTKWTAYLRIFCNHPQWLCGIISKEDLLQAGVVEVDVASDADIEVVADGTEYYRLVRNPVKEERVTSVVGTCISERLRCEDAAHSLHTILHRAALFYHHLHRESTTKFDEVSVKLQYAEPTAYGRDYKPAEHLDAIPLTLTSQGSYEAKTFVLSPSTKRGDPTGTARSLPISLTLHNGYPDLKLWVYIFYFDPNALSISESIHPLSFAKRLTDSDPCYVERWYAPYFARDRGDDAPLPPYGHLRVGCAGSGVNPWQLSLEPEQNADFGWLKIFLSTSPVNLELMLQDSPFENEPRRDPGSVDADELLHKAEWEVRNIALIHRVSWVTIRGN